MRFGRCSPGAHHMARGAEPEARLEPGRTEHHAGRSAGIAEGGVARATAVALAMRSHSCRPHHSRVRA
jgi:hypothetical protein